MKRPAAVFTIALALAAGGLVPEASAQPTEIATCQTINQPGSYVLKQNLTATGTCLVIAASFVTIDLGGFSITGGGGGIAIYGQIGSNPRGFPGIAVRNGAISKFDLGVFIGSVPMEEGGIVEGLRVADVGTGISARGIVKGNTVNCSSGTGIGIIGSGTVTGNHVTNCGSVGIEDTGLVSGNTVEGSGTGISVQGIAIGNSAMGNGVGISATCPSNVIDNVAINNGKNLVLNGTGCNNNNNVAP